MPSSILKPRQDLLEFNIFKKAGKELYKATIIVHNDDEYNTISDHIEGPLKNTPKAAIDALPKEYQPPAQQWYRYVEEELWWPVDA